MKNYTFRQTLSLFGCLWIITCPIIAKEKENLNVLVFTKTNGFRHQSIPESIKQFQNWSAAENWELSFSEDSTDINDGVLKDIHVLVFLNTSGNILDSTGQNALVSYIHNGGGFIGIHVASNTETDWPWFHQMIGARFKDHPKVQSAKIHVNHSFRHPSTLHFKDSFEVVDEWYNFKESVLPHVNVLLTLDETSYQGKKINEEHPIAWYHYYEGGRVLYTGLGHTEEIYSNEDYKKHLTGAINWAGKRIDIPSPDDWESLLDRNLSKWDKYIGVPGPSVDLGIANNQLIDKQQPFGFNHDPTNVFSVVEGNGELILYITGQIYGGISTRQAYGNYHFKAEFKWGKKKWVSEDRNRDTGIIYHCVGPQGTYAKAWLNGLQCQIQETHFGDFISMGKVAVQAHVDSIHYVKDEKRGIYNPKAKLVDTRRSIKNKDMERPTGEWNTLEIICLGTSSIHVINDRVVSAIENAKSTFPSNPEPLRSGRIQLQSEGAEAYYKNIEIKEITSIPKKFKKQMK